VKVKIDVVCAFIPGIPMPKTIAIACPANLRSALRTHFKSKGQSQYQCRTQDPELLNTRTYAFSSELSQTITSLSKKRENPAI
jgi:hypothetical protein